MSSPPPLSPSIARLPRVPLRRRRSWAWLRLFRPLALLGGTAVAVGFAFVLTDGAPAWHEALRLAVVMAAVLGFASVLNDVIDAPHDRNTHLWRPIPAGLVTVDAAQRVVLFLAAVAIAVDASLGWRAFLLGLAGLALALVYSARLKATPFAWLPLALAFALVPLWVAETVDAFDAVLWWSVPVGLSGGLATYLAIKLPDYERDDRDGARNFLHWLTIDYALPIAWLAMGAYIVIAVASANIENLRAEWIVPPASIALVVTLIMMSVLAFRISERRLAVQRWLFAPAVAGLAIGWLGSIIP